MKLTYYLLLIATLLLTACNNDEDEEKEFIMTTPPIGETFEGSETSITFESEDSDPHPLSRRENETSGRKIQVFI